MKRLILIILTILSIQCAQSAGTRIDGLYYYLDSSSLTATVTYEKYQDISSFNPNPTYPYLSGSLVIPEKVTFGGNTYSVTSIGEIAFYGCKGLTSVKIPNSVTSIGRYAFYSCSGLTSVTIPNSITSIGERVFAYCSGLTSVEIPNSVTSIGIFAFYYCSGLTNVTIPNSVTSIGNHAFAGCSGWTSVTIPNSVTSIGEWAFYGCSRLTSVHISDLEAWYNIDFGDDASNPVSYAHHLYLNNQEIKEIRIPESMTVIKNYIFAGLISPPSVTIPHSVTTIGEGAFYGCSGLTSVEIPNSVTSIGRYAFYSCRGLTSMTIPNSVTSIGENVFAYCRGLTSMTIPNSVTSIGRYAFKGCSELTSVEIPNSVTSIGSYAFDECSGLTSVTIPNSVTSIGSVAFAVCSGLKTVYFNAQNCTECGSSSFTAFPSTLAEFIIGDNVLTLPPYMVSGCSSLTNVKIPNSVTSIGGYAFEGCSGLKSMEIPNSVTSIGGSAFSGCSGLGKVHISDLETWCNIDFENETSNPLYYAHHLYLNHQEIKDLKIPESITSIKDNTFQGCSGLTSVTIPNSFTSIGDYAFSGCSGLTSVTIPTSVTSIGNNAFYGCNGLIKSAYPDNLQNPFRNGKSISYPAKNSKIEKGIIYGDDSSAIYFVPINLEGALEIPTTVTSVREWAFSYCSGLTSVTIPTSTTTIENNAFTGCSGLKSITINSNGLLNIGGYAFADCDNIEIINCNSQRPPVATQNSADIFSSSIYSKAIVYVPKGSLSLYYATSPWNRFSNIVEIGDITEVEIHYTGSTTLKAGETLQLSLTPKNMPTNSLAATWSSSNPAVATVSDNGLVTGMTAGTCRITANYGNLSASCEITVTPAIETTVTLNVQEMTLLVGQTDKLKATVDSGNTTGQEIMWSSSNPSVAFVSSDGTVLGVAEGTAFITATYGSASATCVVTVVAGAGVNDIFADSESITIYTVNGVLVKKDATAEDVETLNPGIYIIGGRKVIVK